MSPGVPLSQPIAPSTSVRDGRDTYLAENGFSVGVYESGWINVSFLGISVPTPSTRRRRWGIKMHDLHHVITGFGTDVTGEMEISAWEMRRGLRGLGVYVASIVAGVALLGFILSPRRTLRAWRASRTGGSLFQTQCDYDSLLAMSVGELRLELGVPARGLAEGRRLHAHAPHAQT